MVWFADCVVQFESTCVTFSYLNQTAGSVQMQMSVLTRASVWIEGPRLTCNVVNTTHNHPLIRHTKLETKPKPSYRSTNPNRRMRHWWSANCIKRFSPFYFLFLNMIFKTKKIPPCYLESHIASFALCKDETTLLELKNTDCVKSYFVAKCAKAQLQALYFSILTDRNL